MGTRFMLTSDSPVAATVKDVYLSKSVKDTVLTNEVDGIPQRVMRTGPVEHSWSSSATRGSAGPRGRNARRLPEALRSPWRDMVREGLAMRKAARTSPGARS